MTGNTHPAILWALFPLSAVQGLWLKRVATRLPGAPGPREGSTEPQHGTSGEIHLLALGDSIIDGVGIDDTMNSMPGQFARLLAERTGKKVSWRIEGTSGHRLHHLIDRLATLRAHERVDLLLVSIGVNDVTGLTSLRRWRRRLREFLGQCESAWPGCRVVFAGLPPMHRFPLPPQPLRKTLGYRAAQLDAVARAVIADHQNAVHVTTLIDPTAHPFCDDGFHPAAESCTLWAQALIDSME